MPMPKDPIKADETRKRMSDSQRKRWENPEEHAKTRKSNIAYFETHPEAKEKRERQQAIRKLIRHLNDE